MSTLENSTGITGSSYQILRIWGKTFLNSILIYEFPCIVWIQKFYNSKADGQNYSSELLFWRSYKSIEWDTVEKEFIEETIGII